MAGHVVSGQVEPGHFRSGRGKQPLLDFGGLRELARQNALGLFHFGQAHVLDAGSGDVGHNREQVQIFVREGVNEVRRIEINEPNHAVFGLQRDRHHAANLLLHDAHALHERAVVADIADQERPLLGHHLIAYAVADAEPLALGRANHQFLTLQSHQDAAGRADGFDGQVHDELKQFGQGKVLHQLTASVHQRFHVPGVIAAGCAGAAGFT